MTSNEDIARDSRVTDEEREYSAWVRNVTSLIRAGGSVVIPRERTGPREQQINWDTLLRPGGKYAA